MTTLEENSLASFKKQIKMLRTVYLRDAGFKNVFSQPGYEADDIIASICINLPKNQEAIIIASDHDFYQLLSPNVIVWNPTTRDPMTKKLFEFRYGIKPEQWPLVLAIAGGHDNIKGVPGIGLVTALKYVRDDLPEASKSLDVIRQHEKMIERNLKLVKLPLNGTKSCQLEKSHSLSRWNKVMTRLEMKSLLRE